MRMMTKWDRIEAALHGGEVDRVPISLWKNYHLQDRAPRRLAELTVAFHHQFDTDLIKLTPTPLYPIQDYGATIRFGTDDKTGPVAVCPVVESPEAWENLPRLDVTKGALGRELEAIQHVAGLLEGSVPLLMTIYSPLTVAYKMFGGRTLGDQLVRHLREWPRQVHAGLSMLCDTVCDYAAACLDAGASGMFFATQMATYDLMTRREYEEFGVGYDLRVLASLAGRSRVTMLHICEQNIMFDLVADYPVDVINWADRPSGPSLAQARKMTSKALAGGLSLETLLNGTEEDVLAEAGDASAQAGRIRFLLAPGCVIKGASPDANLLAARRAVEATMRAQSRLSPEAHF